MFFELPYYTLAKDPTSVYRHDLERWLRELDERIDRFSSDHVSNGSPEPSFDVTKLKNFRILIDKALTLARTKNLDLSIGLIKNLRGIIYLKTDTLVIEKEYGSALQEDFLSLVSSATRIQMKGLESAEISLEFQFDLF